MKNLFFISVFIFLTGCTFISQPQLPDFEVSKNAGKVNDCSSIFPQGKWQFVHTIEFLRDDGVGTTVLGITTLSEEMIRSALVTVEGFTLFEASFYNDNSFQIDRAVPPFDTTGFAKGMMADIHAIFRPPPTDAILVGSIREGAATCRYIEPLGRITDIRPNIDDCWQITSYTPDRTMDRSITGRSCTEKGSSRIPEHLELKSYGMVGYTLKMTLLQADLLQ